MSGHNPIIGREVDGYHVMGVLGQGGMGVVYKAEDVELSRTVALKMIAPHVAGDELFLRKFRSEARALARVNSPYIVSIHALRQTSNGVFIVMEYVEGGTLGDVINEGPMPWKKAVPIIKQMLMAFRDAHSLSVIHRDIKPNNIMLSQDGTVKVTDFGLAKVHPKGGDVTVTEGVAGTLYYMSPEQVQGLPRLDHRADLYSLGMTIYEMLTGEVPFDKSASQYSTLKKIVEGKLPLPRERVPGIPAEVEAFVMKALARDPEDRFQSADEMLEALGALEGSAPSKDVVVPPPPKSKALPVLLGVLAVLILAGGYLGYLAFAPDDPALLSVLGPAGATVYIGNAVIGKVPLDRYELDEITENRVSVPLRLEKAGYLTVDTLVYIGPREHIVLSLAMVEQEVGLVISSRPSAARVWIDGEYVGTTPYTAVLPASATPDVRIERQGYKSWRRDAVRLETVGENNIQADLEREAVIVDNDNGDPVEDDDPPPVGQGSLSLSAVPEGTMYVDGAATGAGTVALDAGPHTIRCGSAPYQADTTVTIQPNRTTALSCHFQSTINYVMTGRSSRGSLWINGSFFADIPGTTTLDAGQYQVEAKLEGYDVVNGDTTLVILPVFKERRHLLSFRVQ